MRKRHGLVERSEKGDDVAAVSFWKAEFAGGVGNSSKITMDRRQNGSDRGLRANGLD